MFRCNFYGSKAAGLKLSSMLEMGRSRPWKKAMEVMTGQGEMSTGAIREYFLPLEQWLVDRNRRDNVKVGWGEGDGSTLCQ